ncbi:protein BatD [bacterium]|nr:protein BatD [bacterium]
MQIFSLILILFFSAFSFGADFSISSKLDSYSVSVGEQFIFEVELRISGSAGGDLPVPNLPNLNSFADLISQSAPESSNFSWINGKTERSVTKLYSIVYLAKKEGKFSIPSVSVNFDGKNYRTEPLEIQVVKGGNNKFDSTRNLFVTAETDKKEYFVNEQITVRYKIYTLVNISNIAGFQVPDYTGVITETLNQPSRLETKNVNVDGKNYITAELRTDALFPNKAGELHLESVQVTCDVEVPKPRSQRRSLFDDSFFGNPFGSSQRRVVASNSLSLKIKPLPNENKPEDFTGAVGNFTFSANLSGNTAKIGDALSLNLKVEGTGNIKTLEIPKAKIPSGVEVYEPEFKDDFKKNGQKIYGSKTANYVLVPRKSGEILIPSIKFSYFDPSSAKYVKSETGDFKITVSGDGNSGNFSSAAPIGKQDVVSQGSDIRFIRSELSVSTANEIPSNFWILNVLPILLIGLTYIFIQVQARNEANRGRILGKKAGSIVLKKLKKAKSLVNSGKNEEFYVELDRAILSFFALKFGISEAGVVWEVLKQKLEQKNVEQELILKLEEILNTCNFARFAPASSNHSKKENLINSAIEVITKMEKKI